MKKIFNHTKKPKLDWEEYDNSDNWDEVSDSDEIEDENGEYYAEEENGEYYAEEAAEPVEDENVEYYAEDENGEYYAEEAAEPVEDENGEYYAEDENGEYYTEEAAEPVEDENVEYYAEDENGEYYAEDENGEYYAEDENGEYYAEDENGEYYAEDDTEEYYAPVSRKKAKAPNVFVTLWNKYMDMGVLDRIITTTGVAVLILALVTGSVYVGARVIDKQVSEFASVGNQLDGITMIGEAGLLAVADAEMAKLAASSVVEEQQEEKKEYDENEYSKQVTVALSMTSVEKDLKIKFTNKETGKLVANVPFSVTITTPAGKTETWSDDDMDGIIYKKSLTPGSYSVAMVALADEKYKDYTISTTAQKAEVKKEIAYQKIDVSNEIKKESEINAAKEDTKKKDTVVESALQDTVTWVESTSTASTYREVAKSTVPDPTTLALGKNFARLATYTASITPASQALNVGGTFTVTAQCAGVTLSNVTWSSSNPSVVKVEGSGATAQVTALSSSASAVLVSFTANGTVSNGDAVSGLTGTCSVTVSDTKGTLTFNPAALTVALNAQVSAKATPAGFTAGKELTYAISSNRADIATATIDNAGNITVKGVAAGDAVLTVTANYTGGGAATMASANLNVKVTGNKTITLDKTTATVYMTVPVTINATIANATTDTAVTAESSDTNVATVAVNHKAVTITGVNPGSATVTVKYTENGEVVQATCAVTVKSHPKDDKTNKLKDSSGQQLYVLENDTYREAFYADYYTTDKFFIKGSLKYTGWQTLDGKVYFFTAAGDKVTGEQVIQGAKYNFDSDGALVTGSGTMGIDVSKWNGSIDWNAVKNSGVSYVIIRSGYRGSSKGSLIEDPKFASNIKGATAAGLKVGVYFFTQAVDAVEAVEEASMVLEQVKNYKISYPIFLDVESSGGRGDAIDKETRTAVCKAFCETIRAAGYNAGIYANKTWLNKKIDAGALSAYKIWLAQYAAAPDYTGRYDMWQYKSNGKVSGISGDVDLNLSYLGY